MENTEFKKNHDGNGDIAKQQREMTNSALSDERELRRLIVFKILHVFQCYCGVLDSVSRQLWKW